MAAFFRRLKLRVHQGTSTGPYAFGEEQAEFQAQLEEEEISGR